MTHLMRTTAVVAAAAVAATLASSSVASARAGDRNFPQTFPFASQLCAKLARGSGPRRLRRPRVRAKALADCAVLDATFKAARAAVLAAEGSITSARAAQATATRSACAGRAAASAACLASRRAQNQLDAQLSRERMVVARTYFRTVEAARDAFWRAIGRLPGGRDLREDAPIPIQSD